MSANQKSGQTDTTTDVEQRERNQGAFDVKRRNVMKFAGGLATTTAGLSMAPGEVSAGSVYWDGVVFSQASYDYAPSVMYGDGSRMKMWFCHPYYGDAIWYTELTSSGWTDPDLALPNGSGDDWDEHHACDPTVVTGDFYADGAYWDYAMYYVGSSNVDGTDDEHNNKIGVAFSDDGVNWHKYSDNPVIRPKHEPTNSYGAGFPAAYRVAGYDDYVYLAFYDSTDGDQNHYVTASDGKNFGSRTTLTSDPHDDTGMGGIGYDPYADRWYISTKHNSDRVSYLYKTANSDLNSTWYHEATIGGDDTGYTHNHNLCWITWPNGRIYEDDDGYNYVYLAVGSSDPDSWDIGQARFWG